MWSIANTTPYVVGVDILRDRHGAETLVTVVKATFAIDSTGTCSIADEQSDIVRVPTYAGDPVRSSLLSETDFVPTKPGTDILLGGHAYSPSGSRVSVVEVRLTVGAVTKRLRVTGNRRWERGVASWRPTSPTPFERLAIVYERAYGGAQREPQSNGVMRGDGRNPAGTGFETDGKPTEGALLPNVEYIDRTRIPAGYGPIARHWSPRRELAGTYDQTWLKERHPLVPDDFDDRFYHAAPVDQQTARPLHGGEPVVLENLTPDGYWAFSLPRVPLVLNTRIGSAVETSQAQLQTVLLEPDERRIVMVWLSTLRCHGRTQTIDRVHVREKPRLTLGGHSGLAASY